MPDDFVPSAPPLSGMFTDEDGHLEDKDMPYEERQRSCALWLKHKNGRDYLTGKLGKSNRRLTLWIAKGWKLVKVDDDEEWSA